MVEGHLCSMFDRRLDRYYSVFVYMCGSTCRSSVCLYSVIRGYIKPILCTVCVSMCLCVRERESEEMTEGLTYLATEMTYLNAISLAIS